MEGVGGVWIRCNGSGRNAIGMKDRSCIIAGQSRELQLHLADRAGRSVLPDRQLNSICREMADLYNSESTGSGLLVGYGF